MFFSPPSIILLGSFAFFCSLAHFRIMTFSIQQAKRFYYRPGSPAALRHTAGTGYPNVGIINDTPSICLLTSPGPTPGATIIFYVSPCTPLTVTHTKATLLIITVYPILDPVRLHKPTNLGLPCDVVPRCWFRTSRP